jgi:prepilin-type N-terminal cleavage/methylation domain-containing protein
MRNQRGFTLIELMVVITITAILLGFTTINLVGSQQRASLNAIEQELLADLKQQQLKAMIGDTEGRETSDTYGIHFDSGKYTLFHGTYSSTDSANFAINLDQNFQFQSPGTDIIFSKISGEISAGSITNIAIRDTTNGNVKTITVNRYGVVTQIQ